MKKTWNNPEVEALDLIATASQTKTGDEYDYMWDNDEYNCWPLHYS